MAISIKCDHCGQYSSPSEFTSAPAGWLTFTTNMTGMPFNAKGTPRHYSGNLTSHICPDCVKKFKPKHLDAIYEAQGRDKDMLIEDVLRNLIYATLEEQRDA